MSLHTQVELDEENDVGSLLAYLCVRVLQLFLPIWSMALLYHAIMPAAAKGGPGAGHRGDGSDARGIASNYAPLDGDEGSWENQQGGGGLDLGGGGRGSSGVYGFGSVGGGGGDRSYYYDGLDDETGAMAIGGYDSYDVDTSVDADDRQLDLYGTTPMRDL